MSHLSNLADIELRILKKRKCQEKPDMSNQLNPRDEEEGTKRPSSSTTR